MILGKILMIQSASKYGSVDYQICKSVLRLGKNIEKYTIDRFVREIGVSKTSLIRYLDNLGVNTFSLFKEVVVLESIKGLTALEQKKDASQKQFDSTVINLAYLISEANRILILGDGNCFGLILYLKGFIHLGIDMEIPIYLGKEETVFKEYDLKDDDLVIFVSLHETFESFLNSRTVYYNDIKYFQFDCPSKVVFIGEIDFSKTCLVDYQISIETDGPLYYRKARLERLFEDMLSCLCLNYDYI